MAIVVAKAAWVSDFQVDRIGDALLRRSASRAKLGKIRQVSSKVKRHRRGRRDVRDNAELLPGRQLCAGVPGQRIGPAGDDFTAGLLDRAVGDRDALRPRDRG